MNDVTNILAAIDRGELHAAERLLPHVYDELRRLAAGQMAREKPGQTLDATALVHEAYLRLAGPADERRWENRRHFFAAAAEAMRRILVDKARQRKSAKRGGDVKRSSASPDELAGKPPGEPLEILAVHEALDRLAAKSPRKAELVKLRYFLGCTIPEAADVLCIAPATAEEDWTYAKAWLRKHLDPA